MLTRPGSPAYFLYGPANFHLSCGHTLYSVPLGSSQMCAITHTEDKEESVPTTEANTTIQARGIILVMVFQRNGLNRVNSEINKWTDRSVKRALNGAGSPLMGTEKYRPRRTYGDPRRGGRTTLSEGRQKGRPSPTGPVALSGLRLIYLHYRGRRALPSSLTQMLTSSRNILIDTLRRCLATPWSSQADL